MSKEDIKKKMTDGLRIALSTKQMRQKDLAKILGTSEATVSRYLNGEGIPNAITLMRICSTLGLSFEYFNNILEGKVND